MRTSLGLFLVFLICFGTATPALTSLYNPTNFLENSSLKECGDSLFAGMVTPLGYPFSSATVTTDDGYVLKLFRIQAKNTQMTSGKPVVFLQHGLFDSADDWVINGEQYSLGFILANAGYDVWFGNSRGNKYSRVNINIPPSKREFWQFSFQQMGEFDVKANIGYILAFTGQQKLVYVGHSQGTSQMFAALGDPKTAPFINAKVSKFIALAPVVFLPNITSKFFLALQKDNALIAGAEIFGIEEWLPGACSTTSAQTEFEVFVCTKDPTFCDWIIGIMDYDPTYDNEANMPQYMKHLPSGTSLMCMLHYKQLIDMPKTNPLFMKFDYGPEGNKKHYNQLVPPLYHLSNANIPIRGFVGLQDELGDPTDNTFLKATLAALNKDYTEYRYNNCGHITFMWGLNPSQIMSDVLAEIKASAPVGVVDA